MEGRGAGMGGMPGAPPIILDAGAQEYYPAVVGGAAAYPPFLPLTPQQLYCPPPYQAMPPPPPPMALPLPLPMPMPIPIPQQIGPTAAAAAAAVDAPASRAVVLSLVPPHAQEGDVARAMAAFGAVRAVDASAVPSERVATVHFFDLRAAELAVAAVRAQHMRQQCRLSQLYAATVSWPPSAAGPGPAPAAWDWPHDDILGLVLGQAVWAQFAAASTLPDDGFSRGSLVVLNSLPDDVSLLELRQAFQAFGDLKDLRQSPHRPSHKFVEFFDTRDAARALAELNGQDFFGHRLVLEFTRPSTPGFRRRGYVLQQQPMAPIPPRLQQAWRPTFPQASSSSSGTGRGREGVVLMRRSSSAKSSGSGDRSKGGNNNNNNGAGRSHERKGKGGKKPTIVVVASSSASSSSTTEATTASSSGKQQCVKSVGRAGSGRSHRGWKGRFDKQFEFKEPEAAAADDTDTQEPETRTTVMIRNIPNKYSQKLVLNMLDAHCIVHNKKQIEAGESECQGQQQPLSSYDFLYLPIDFK
ncbi:hypothetical protein BRADI_2g58100v3 [Brachypodium distachyon]|nr:hypothetical protein BRADI_2g58100v3 [Brachypodium distachyon]